MDISITELRKNTKKYFDTALHSPVHIERGGVRFKLQAELTPVPQKTDVSDLFTPEKKSAEATPLGEMDLADRLVATNGEHPCCGNEFKLCSHWVWDAASGEGYRNSLSGRLMEVE